MWTYEHSVDSRASADAVFALFSDVSTWREWNAGVEHVELDGPFIAGATGRMTLPDQEPIAFRLTWTEQGRGFEDEVAIPAVDVVVRVRHSLEPLSNGGTRITYRCVIDGPAADVVGPELGPGITADFPDVMTALSALAEAAAGPR